MKTNIISKKLKKARTLIILPVAAAMMGAWFAAVSAAPIVRPLNNETVPDVNELGILDQSGPNAGQWTKITNTDKKRDLKQLGKGLFWDMQVGGDGIQSCASCHFHAGADHRKTNQMSPGVKAGDAGHSSFLPLPNGTLTLTQYTTALNVNGNQIGFPVDEAALIIAGAAADAPNGTPSAVSPVVKLDNEVDGNDVVSSQGIRLGTFVSLTELLPGGPFGRIDTATLAASDNEGFNFTFSANAPGIPDTVRRVEPRNSPTVLNAIFNFRNFWDGRADPFFNGVNPLGFRDPDARVKVYSGQEIGDPIGTEHLAIPFSSAASQAVGPVLSRFEMHWDPRSFNEVGKKLSSARPLAGQLVSCSDSLLGGLTDCTTPGTSNRGLRVTVTYGNMIKSIFDERFWGNGAGLDVCLNASDAVVACNDPSRKYTLLERNFPLFFGLGVQAYEATLTTENTMVDLTQGGIATGTLTNGTGGNRKVVNVAGLPLQDCIALLALNNNAAQLAVATNLCTAHYAKFIDPGAVAGAQATLATTPFLNQVTPAAPTVLPNDAIGGCVTPSATCTVTGDLAKAKVTLLAIDRGLNRFFAGNTACGVCHVTPQFTLQTVAGLTGFGAAAPLPEPPGLLRKAPPERPMERMIAFNGAAAVYDAGFYNIGIRPTPEDLMIGDQIGGVPLAFSKLAEIIAGGDATGFDPGKIGRIAAEFTGGLLQIPTSPTNLAPRPWSLDLICGPGLNGNGNGEPNNNPIPRCVTNVIPGERLLRHGAAHTPTLRNVKFTGPYFHNGAKMNLDQVFETYATAGHMTTLNFNNLDAGMRLINIAPEEKAAVIEMMETGLTDWRVAFEKGKFDHPEICVPNGHDVDTGKTVLAGIPAVGSGGNANRLQTFEEQLNGVNTGRAQTLADDCTVPDVTTDGETSDIDVPPAPL